MREAFASVEGQSGPFMWCREFRHRFTDRILDLSCPTFFFLSDTRPSPVGTSLRKRRARDSKLLGRE